MQPQLQNLIQVKSGRRASFKQKRIFSLIESDSKPAASKDQQVANHTRLEPIISSGKKEDKQSIKEFSFVASPPKQSALKQDHHAKDCKEARSSSRGKHIDSYTEDFFPIESIEKLPLQHYDTETRKKFYDAFIASYSSLPAVSLGA